MAAGTCVARVLGAEMTGDPAMLASGCEEDIEVMPRRDRGLVNHLVMGPIYILWHNLKLELTLIAAKQSVCDITLFVAIFRGSSYNLTICLVANKVFYL